MKVKYKSRKLENSPSRRINFINWKLAKYSEMSGASFFKNFYKNLYVTIFSNVRNHTPE